MLRMMRMRTRMMTTMWMMGSLERTRMMRPKMTTPCRMRILIMATKIMLTNSIRDLLKTPMKEKAPQRRMMMTMVVLVSKMMTKKARDS